MRIERWLVEASLSLEIQRLEERVYRGEEEATAPYAQALVRVKGKEALLHILDAVNKDPKGNRGLANTFWIAYSQLGFEGVREFFEYFLPLRNTRTLSKVVLFSDASLQPEVKFYESIEITHAGTDHPLYNQNGHIDPEIGSLPLKDFLTYLQDKGYEYQAIVGWRKILDYDEYQEKFSNLGVLWEDTYAYEWIYPIGVSHNFLQHLLLQMNLASKK